MLGFPILYCKGMRPMMFQLSGFCLNPKMIKKNRVKQKSCDCLEVGMGPTNRHPGYSPKGPKKPPIRRYLGLG